MLTRSTPARGVLVLQVAVMMAVLVAACTSGRVNGGPLPTLVVPSTISSTTLDYTAIDLGTVGGRNIVHVSIGPGTAALSGTVSGPTGPIGGGIVRVERVVDGYVSPPADVATLADGTWTLPAILGGLFRVRAWRAPDLALTQPAIFFLAARDTKTLELRVDRFAGTQITSAIAPNPPIIGQPAQLAVQVTTTSVDDQGVVRTVPKSGASVQLVGVGNWGVVGSLTQTAGPSGLVTWVITCQALGPQVLSVVVDAGDVSALNLPACAPVPTTTTSPPTSSTTPTSTPGGSTTVKPKTTTTTAA